MLVFPACGCLVRRIFSCVAPASRGDLVFGLRTNILCCSTMTQPQKKTRRQMLEEFVAAKPNDAFARYGLAMDCANAGDAAAADEHFKTLLSSHPDYVAAYFQYGQFLARIGRTEEARSALTAGIATATAHRRRSRAVRDGSGTRRIGLNQAPPPHRNTLISCHLKRPLLGSVTPFRRACPPACPVLVSMECFSLRRLANHGPEHRRSAAPRR